MGDWYCGEFFTYLRIRGHNSVHLLLRFVPDIMVLEEVAFQTAEDGAHDRFSGLKRRDWPKFMLYTGHLVIHNYSHAHVLSVKLKKLKFGLGVKRMHDSKKFIEQHFLQAQLKNTYIYETQHDDSIY